MSHLTTIARCLVAVACLSVVPAAVADPRARSQPCAPQCESEGQSQRRSQSPQPASEREQQPRGQTPQQTPREPRERERSGRPVNLQIELTITDQIESEPAQKKTVSMIVADRTTGRVRASGLTQLRETPGAVSVRLNVDARPEIQANDTIRLQLTLEYEPLPPAPAADASRRPTLLHESLTVILQPGKPLTVSRAVDPFTNRRTSVDVIASIAK